MTPVLDAAASAAAFPLGGIGTGNVSIGARGEFRDWELFNRPAKGRRNPFTFFALRVAEPGGDPMVRVLEARHRPPHPGDQGYGVGDVAGLPRFDDARMRGRYPLLELDLRDDRLPVEVGLTAFTPFVPLESADSGIPVAVLRYRLRNRSASQQRATIAGSLANPLGSASEPDRLGFPVFEGRPRIDWRDEAGIRGLWLTTDLPSDDHRFGTMALTTRSPASGKPTWLYGAWQDGVQVFWDEFRRDGALAAEPEPTLDPEPHPDWFTRLRVGSVAVSVDLDPGEERDIEFRLTWHLPNRPRGWDGNIIRDDPFLTETVRNAYATRYDDAWEVAADVDRRLPDLERSTREFVTALYDSSLPAPVVDAVGSNLSAIRSTTCFVLEGDVFAAWEGSFDHAGSCEGTCTHVWNYAQALAWLFPDLERSARRTEFLLETRDDGRMNFRTNRVFGSPAWDFHPAADGQLGAIVRVYREWLLSGDDDFLRELWPQLRRSLEFAAREWDADGDGVLDSRQHNTYDIEFYGENSLANSLFIAALHAAARLADHLGEAEAARDYLARAERCAERMDALLFNGEYYQQRLDDVDAMRYQYGDGVLSDQLLGQLLAHVVGIGHVLPHDHVRSAIAAVHRHNFRSDLSEHESVQRTYALGDEGGLVLCSWPRGGRPRIPFVYSDEVWTGIEHQVAAHLAYEGMPERALEIVAATRGRYDGVRRNPWNEVECGNHYARSLSSWALLLAWTGQRSNAAAGALSFAPIDDVLDAPFSTGTAWGRIRIDADGVRLEVLGGRLRLTSLHVHGRELLDAPIQLDPGDIATAGPDSAPTSARSTS
jgi:non-lysosomal glucosylceramidase